MRQVYTSLRVETVEGVARLLKDAGIDVHIANGRSYHSKRGGQFSYAEPMRPKQQPSVWVRHAEDQPRAREILREAGLIASSRQGQSSALLFAAPVEAGVAKRPLAWKIRIALLLVIAMFAVGSVIRYRSALPAPAARTPAAATQAAVDAPTEAGEEEEVRIRIPAPAQPPPPEPRP